MLPPATGIPDRAAQVIAYQSGVLDLVCELLDDLSRQRRPIAVLSPAISDTVHGFLQALCESNKSNQEVVFNETISSIKGLQLNRDAASIEAYKKGKEKIDQQVALKLIQTIM